MLLFQDLAVVPLLVITPLLGKIFVIWFNFCLHKSKHFIVSSAPSAGTSVVAAVRSAILKAAMALSGIAFAGR